MLEDVSEQEHAPSAEDEPGVTHSNVLNPDYFKAEKAPDASSNTGTVIDFQKIIEQSGSAAEQIGRIVRAYGTTVHVSGVPAHIGQRGVISTPGEDKETFADVVGIAGSELVLYLLGSIDGISNNSQVRLLQQGKSVQFSESLVGCILDGAGQLIYQPFEQHQSRKMPIDRAAPNALTRSPIDSILSTGVKAIDAMLTVGVGQRVGIFAAAGAGKSTLLSMMARNADADVIVIGLIGERGREVREFIDQNLGIKGMEKSVLIVSTSDRPAMERVTAAQCATTIAEGFRDQGKRVLLLIDSITRYARALREIGLSVGEPPVRRGFPPSVFAELPRLLERSGNNDVGSITAFYTVLVEDEDTSDPIAEEVKSILDGHIELSRALGARGHYPPIDILSSTSRLFPIIADKQHQNAAMHLRTLLAKYQEIELLLQMGEYTEGADAEADLAIAKRADIEHLLRQSPDESVDLETTLQTLMELGA